MERREHEKIYKRRITIKQKALQKDKSMSASVYIPIILKLLLVIETMMRIRKKPLQEPDTTYLQL